MNGCDGDNLVYDGVCIGYSKGEQILLSSGFSFLESVFLTVKYNFRMCL